MNLWRAILLLSGLLLTGCSRVDPLDRPIEAANDLDYNTWQKNHFGTLPPEHREHYREAVQEIRYFIMTELSGLSAADQRRKLLMQLDGLKPRTVIAQGMLFANARIEPELRHDRGVLQRNEFLLNKTPNTSEQEANLKEAIASIQARIARAEEKIRLNEELIQRLDASAIITDMKGPSKHSTDPWAKSF